MAQAPQRSNQATLSVAVSPFNKAFCSLAPFGPFVALLPVARKDQRMNTSGFDNFDTIDELLEHARCERDNGNTDEAASLLETILDLTRRQGDMGRETTTLFELASARLEMGAWSSAREIASKGLDACRLIGHKAGEMAFHGLLGQLQRRLENYEQALDHMLCGLELAQECCALEREVVFYADLANLSLVTGNSHTAAAQADAGLRRACELDNGEMRLAFIGIKAQSLRMRGETEAAQLLLEEGIRLAELEGSKDRASLFRHDLALLAQDLGNKEQAEELFRKVSDEFARTGKNESLYRAQQNLTRLLSSDGWSEEAAHSLAKELITASQLDKHVFQKAILRMVSILEQMWTNKEHELLKESLSILQMTFVDSKEWANKFFAALASFDERLSVPMANES